MEQFHHWNKILNVELTDFDSYAEFNNVISTSMSKLKDENSVGNYVPGRTADQNSFRAEGAGILR